MLFADAAADRQLVSLIVLGIVVALLALAYVTVKFLYFLRDRDEDGVWVMALEPGKYAETWESLFDCAVQAERICGAEYFSLIWPAGEFFKLQAEMGFDHGLFYRGEQEIRQVLKQADRYWNRPRLWAFYPPIRRRLQRQYQTFCEVANFALQQDLILMLVMLEPIDDQTPAGED